MTTPQEARAEFVAAWNDLPDTLRCHPGLKRLYRAAGQLEPAERQEKPVAPFWHAVVSKRSPVIDKAIRREDVASEYANKCRQHADDVEVVALYAEPSQPAPLTDEELRKMLPEPFDYCYEWDGAYGTRKFSPSQHNGRKPDRSVPIYTADQMLDAMRAVERKVRGEA